MERKYLLPAMKSDIVADAKECWKEIEDSYDFLISNLKLYFAPNESVFDGGSNAMPHIFEQMLIFHKAFFDETNSEHNRAIAEWRAVLSIMALQKVCNIKLDVVRVDLSGENENAFLKAAHQFCPEDAPVLFNTTWDFLYVVRVKEVPIAVFSPITIVCPAKQFLKKVKELQIQWFVIEKINDIEKLRFGFKGEKREIWDLLKWLKKLKETLNYNNSEKENCYNKYEKVLLKLEKFIDEYEVAGIEKEVSPIQYGVYNSMNNSVRKEYDFLNNCCGVTVKNAKLRFLIERYQEDIFEQKILILVYDDAPDTMDKEENISKLNDLYRNILEIENGKPIIEVYETSGRRMAACVFLPLKNHFVEELIQKKITPNEFFGLFTAVYSYYDKSLEITLQIKEFPYYFEKMYYMEDWQYLYGKDLEATYIWPTNCVDTAHWNTYYIYTEKNNDTQIEVSVPEATSKVVYSNGSQAGNNKEFQLCKSNTFPAYLCYTYQGVSGFLPIWTRNLGTDKFGPTAYIIFDIGHATTSLAIVKDAGDEVQKPPEQEWQDIGFKIPQSSRIVGNENPQSTVRINFVPSDEPPVCNCIKNMLHNFRGYNKDSQTKSGIQSFEDGQILFDSSAYMNERGQSIVSYINYEYAQMDQPHREEVYIFIEQLLSYIFYQAVVWGCSYTKIYVLHSYDDNIVCADENAADKDDTTNTYERYINIDSATRLGELRGLWKNVLNNARKKTGINITGTEDIVMVRNCDALMWFVYQQIYNQEITEEYRFSQDTLNIGINIGWKHTSIVFLSLTDNKSKEQNTDDNNASTEQYTKIDEQKYSDTDSENALDTKNPNANNTSPEQGTETVATQDSGINSKDTIKAEYITLEYAGRNISMLKDAASSKLGLKVYPNILNILLSGEWAIGKDTGTSRMLEEFAELFNADSKTKDITHYQGVFDMIAMKIEAVTQEVAPDIFNNVYEFRYFLMVVTYNIMLLFLEVGILIGKCKKDDIKKINVFMGGNGSKFFKWISHDKGLSVITHENADELTIVNMKKNILKRMLEAAGVHGGVEIQIIFSENANQQLVQGCKTGKLKRELKIPKFTKHAMDDILSSDECHNLVKMMNALCADIFPFASQLDHKDIADLIQPAHNMSVVKIIENERKEICDQVIEIINNIS